MIEPFPEEWELVSFFEAESDDAEPDVPVPYRDLSYKSTLSDTEWVTCVINRADESVLIEWYRDERLALCLQLHWVTELHIEREKGHETLLLRFKDSNLEALRLRLRPNSSLGWGIKMYP